jgi:two-component system sensor histidine kinase/response regulator
MTQAVTAARSTRPRRNSVPGASADTLRELEALRAHAEHLETLIEGSADIIYEADARGHFTFINGAVRAILGLEPSSLIGHHYSELIREDRRQATIDYYREQSRLAHPTTYFEFPAIGSGGRVVWIAQSVQTVVRDGAVTGFRAIARDVTERRTAEERFQAFMNNSPAVAFIKQADGRYVYANELMNRTFATPGKDVLGLSDADLLPPDIAESIRTNDEEVLHTGRSMQVIESAPTDDDQVRHFLTYKFPVHAADGATYVGGMAIDLTERISLERDLATARDAALDSARQKSQFLANMSHEIRTPMNGVIGLLGVLLDTGLNADQKDLAQTARSSAEALLTIINDILDFSKIEAGKLDFEVLEFDVRSTCETTIDLLADAARRKSLEIGYVLDPDIPKVLRGDSGRLRQILLNLIGNAIKFTEHGGVLVQIEREADCGDSVVLRFRITDTGVGIAQSTREQLFRPFSQGDASTTRRFGGTGLGLAISKQLVQMMQGEIGVESEPGCGSTFSFTAQFACSDRAAATDVEQASSGPRVLVIDDSTTTRQMVALQLTAWRLSNDTADDAFTALAMLREANAAGTPYDIVISDLQMPQIDGMSLARLVKNNPDLGSPRFVLITASAESRDASQLKANGVSTYLRKPVKQEHLFSALFGKSMTQLPAAAPQPERPAAPLHSSRRVLVVDDNVVNQKVALRQLQKLGFAAEAVGNGIEALDALGRIAYDLVLMDCQMPEMDGYEAAAELRRREDDSKRTPLIALTASASEADRRRCLAAGMDDFLAKPVRESDLAAMLHQWIPNNE